jgi:hypothetical protein
MAKYTRFDPRNKKYTRHKKQSLDRDIRIRDVKSDTKDSYKLIYKFYQDDKWDESVLE